MKVIALPIPIAAWTCFFLAPAGAVRRAPPLIVFGALAHAAVPGRPPTETAASRGS